MAINHRSEGQIRCLSIGNLGNIISEKLSASSNFSVVDFATKQDTLERSDFLIAGELERVVEAIPALHKDAVLLSVSNQPPEALTACQEQLKAANRADIFVMDSPVSSSSGAVFVSGSSFSSEKSRLLLEEIATELYYIPGDLGNASKLHTIHQMLVGIHTAAAAEAVALAMRAGLDMQRVYNIISGAAGGSSSFTDCVPRMMREEWISNTTVDTKLQDMGRVTATGSALHFPLPMSSTVEQVYTLGASRQYGAADDASILRIYSPGTSASTTTQASEVNGKQHDPRGSAKPITRVGVIGLGAMGFGMAASLVQANYTVTGYDVWRPSVEKFIKEGPSAFGADTAAEAVANTELVILMVQSAAQVDDVLFGRGNAIAKVADDSLILLSATVPPSYASQLSVRLAKLGRGIQLVDAPVSGGAARAAQGKLTFIYSGNEVNINRLKDPLLAMSGTDTNLFIVPGSVGSASSVKLINQLLAGVHIAAAAEAMALATRMGLDLSTVNEVIKSSKAWSWMFENRVIQIVNSDWTPFSALAIFVKDMGIVVSEAKRLGQYAPVSAAAHNLYLEGAARGLAKEADIGVYRVWPFPEALIKTPKDATQPLPATSTLQNLPNEYAGMVIDDIQNAIGSNHLPILVVLDDDPTGTQTCHDINVLMVWDEVTLASEFQKSPTGFFILTNSRALPSAEARSLLAEICRNVKAAADKSGVKVDIVLRGDSTLRGHLPEEPEAVESVFGDFDGWILAPFFFQGGRYTIDDVHYVKEGDKLVPASQTQFAKDATFGYKNSNLRKYIIEKCGNRFDDSSFVSITLQNIRTGGPSSVAQKLLSSPHGRKTVIIVNAAAESDMYVFAAGAIEASKQGRRYLYRTGAAFVSSRLGIRGIAPLQLRNLEQPRELKSVKRGGLIVAGSYVPKTTAQLECLRTRRGAQLKVIELDVRVLIKSANLAGEIVHEAAQSASETLATGQDVLVMTSRDLILGGDSDSSLQVGSQIAKALVLLVQGISVQPRYLMAKGGITSSDAATKGLGMKSARVVGQAAPGIPLWVCSESTSKYPGLPYVVFPGNVGSDTTLGDLVEDWAE